MNEKKYHTSKIIIFIDLLLCLVLVGFLFLPKHLIKYFSQLIELDAYTLTMKKGIFNIDIIEVPYDKVNSVSVKQTFLGRIFNYGDVIIYTGNDVAGLEFKMIDKPNELRDDISSV